MSGEPEGGYAGREVYRAALGQPRYDVLTNPGDCRLRATI